MNTLAKENVTDQQLPVVVAAMLTAWRESRSNGTSFGDWSHAQGVEAMAAIAEKAIA
jgi:sulfite reductase beta subunit-like hemoprotein